MNHQELQSLTIDEALENLFGPPEDVRWEALHLIGTLVVTRYYNVPNLHQFTQAGLLNVIEKIRAVTPGASVKN